MMGLEEAYRTYRLLLVNAVARLARQGFQMPPADALDLIHSFFLEEWPSIMKTYDADRGNLRPYIYAAFTHYARRVILRHMRLRGQLLGNLDGMAFHSDDDAELRVDSQVAAEAMMTIPLDERSVLEAFLELSNEREVARRLGLSRHIVHETLARALARVVLALERPVGIEEGDWNVTRMILDRGYTARNAAAALGKNPDEVRSIHRRNLEGLIARLRQASHVTATVRGY